MSRVSLGRFTLSRAAPLGRLARPPAGASACRALSTSSSDAQGGAASPATPPGSRPDGSVGEDGPVRLVRWSKFGKTLKPEDIGSLLAYGKLSTESVAVDVVAEPTSALPTVRPRIKMHDALRDVPVSEIVYTVSRAPAPTQTDPPPHSSRALCPRRASANRLAPTQTGPPPRS
jgi:hypothetical protein